MDNQIESNTDQLLDPKELAAAFEQTMNFVKGDTEALPDMMAHTGRLLLKLSRRLSTTQMVLLVGALTLGAVFVAKRLEETIDEVFDDEDENRKALASGSSAGGKGNQNQASAQNQSGASTAKNADAQAKDNKQAAGSGTENKAAADTKSGPSNK